MPGLSQLKQFNSDILSLGDEITIRASRGESPVKVPIPKEVQDVNDSEDFVLGMPENEAPEDLSNVEEDLSDLVGLGDTSKKETQTEAAPAFEAPDLSSLLNPINVPDDASAGNEMPDLSMFMEPEETPEEPVEEEPEEVSVADLGLDALLAGAGFDAPEPEEESEETENQVEPLNPDDFEEISDLEDFNTETKEPGKAAEINSDTSNSDNIDSPKDTFDIGDTSGMDFNVSDSKNEDSFPDFDESLFKNEPDVPELSDVESPLPEENSSEDKNAFDDSIPDLDDLDALDDLNVEVPETSDNLLNNKNAEEPSDSLTPEDLDLEEINQEQDVSNPESEDFSLPDSGETFDIPELDDIDLDNLNSDSEKPEDSASSGNLDSLTDLDSAVPDLAEDLASEQSADNDIPDLDSDIPDLSEDLGSEENQPSESFPSDLQETSDSNIPDFDTTGLDDISDLSGLDDSIKNAETTDDVFDTSALDTSGLDGDFASDTKNSSAENPLENDENEGSAPDGLFDSSDLDSDFSTEGMDEGTPSDEQMNLDSLNDLGDLDNLNDSGTIDQTSADSSDSDREPSDENSSEDGSENDFDGVPEEDFDTSEMDNMDFGIPDTDSQLKGEGPDFELGGKDDFAMEGEFEIPGFSDVDTAKDEKSGPVITAAGKEKGKGKHKAKKGKADVDEADFSGALESENLPPNTLSDEQYKTFLKNFNEYPLNVRLAFEDFIVQDEFTDDAEFEIIEKILNKAPARQVASLLEKMLDISIPVPRDYEHRTAEEYEAYKKSLSYQLKNKIIPGMLVGAVCLLLFWGLFNFTRYCIVRPLVANHYYKQGYALLQQDEYPQSEINFEKAIEKRYNKNWFFKYARGYREHKQYQRAEKMYENILICFKQDKQAGLEYADMELNDLANYERAEEIVKRDILDYHINDSDGILKLGDVYLEWGTEKDPEKLENAREQYATLIQLYGSNDLYESRMMRYFIRTDNLRQVLGLQKRFEPKEKSLCAEDWTELSGYLLDKYYGTISPSDEYLRYQIEGLRGLLLRAVKTGEDNPVALYNLSRYYVFTDENSSIEPALTKTIDTFNHAKSLKKRDVYKYIDSYRLLGEHYISTNDYLKSQEQLAEGISLYTTERDNAGFEGNKNIGKLYEDLANLKYFVSGDYDDALNNYKSSIELENDSSAIRYKIGYIQYKKSNYAEALGSFMKAGDGNVKEQNLMQAMANTLSLRGDDYAAQGYYEQLLQKLDDQIAEKSIVFPQANASDNDLINTYLTASNNYGVTLYKLAKRTGNSNLNAQAIVQLSQSVRAWDALTRNQETMVRLGGSNLAEQNIKYITNRIPDFEPAIYLDIKKTMSDKEKF